MDRLTYEEYKGNKDILVIDLYNNYSVIAIKLWNSETHNYTVEFRLQQNTVDKWDLIDETFYFDVDYKIINKAILKQVSTLLSTGFFEKYINRYEYELGCFDLGNEIEESHITNFIKNTLKLINNEKHFKEEYSELISKYIKRV